MTSDHVLGRAAPTKPSTHGESDELNPRIEEVLSSLKSLIAKGERDKVEARHRDAVNKCSQKLQMQEMSLTEQQSCFGEDSDDEIVLSLWIKKHNDSIEKYNAEMEEDLSNIDHIVGLKQIRAVQALKTILLSSDQNSQDLPLDIPETTNDELLRERSEFRAQEISFRDEKARLDNDLKKSQVLCEDLKQQLQTLQQTHEADLENEKKQHVATQSSRDALQKELQEKEPCYQAGFDLRIGRLERYDASKPRSSHYWPRERAQLILRRNWKAHRGQFRCDRHCLLAKGPPLLISSVNRLKEIYGVGYQQKILGDVLTEIVDMRGTLALCLFFLSPPNDVQSKIDNLFESALAEAGEIFARCSIDHDRALEIDKSRKLKVIRDEMMPIMKSVEKDYIDSLP